MTSKYSTKKTPQKSPSRSEKSKRTKKVNVTVGPMVGQTVGPIIGQTVGPMVEPTVDRVESSTENVASVSDKINDQSNDQLEENANKNDDISFILRRNKKSHNYSILRKVKNTISTKNTSDVERIRYKIHNAYLPFGCETYKDNMIVNVIIDDSTNFNHNLLVTFNRIIETFKELKETDVGKYKYSINDKTFFTFLKECEIDRTKNTNPTEKPIKKYQLRFYLRYGAKVTHSKLVGEMSHDQLKGRWCTLDIELGSMWVNNETKQYGLNIYITHITVR
jgi:hypothetical protein